jgi:hypothetical protein
MCVIFSGAVLLLSNLIVGLCIYVLIDKLKNEREEKERLPLFHIKKS